MKGEKSKKSKEPREMIAGVSLEGVFWEQSCNLKDWRLRYLYKKQTVFIIETPK